MEFSRTNGLSDPNDWMTCLFSFECTPDVAACGSAIGPVASSWNCSLKLPSSNNQNW